LKRNGIDVLCSFDGDINEDNLDKTEKGNFQYLLKLPTDILKAGLYTLTLDVGLIGIGTIEKHDEIITFKISELDQLTTTKGYAEERAGILYKQIEWKRTSI